MPRSAPDMAEGDGVASDATVTVAPKAPINDLPFDAMVHVGGGIYELVRIGEPMPVIIAKEG